MAPVLMSLAIGGCARPAGDVRPALYPTDLSQNRRPAEITFLLPGALTTAEIFRPAQDWASEDHQVVEYRLPGMQGEPVAPPLDIVRSATWVADYANRYPEAKINLLGYSTGAAIAIEAAARIIPGERVRVAAVSSPTPFPGAALAGLRGGLEVAGSAIRIGSLDRQKVWEDYYKTLYFGKGWRRSAEKRERSERLEDIVRGRVLAPGGGVGKAQSASLLFWKPSEATRSASARITFFHGEKDPVFPLPAVRRLAKRLDGEICVLPEAGHLVFQSVSDLVERIEAYFQGEAASGTCE
jgi:pimeloyl-ACP methyl ester carboxylesterase